MFYPTDNYFAYRWKVPGSSAKEFFSENIDEDFEVIEAIGTKKFTFLAVQKKDQSSPVKETFLLIARTISRPNSYRNYTYRFFNETEILNYTASRTSACCPEKILKLLTPPEILYKGALLDKTLKKETFNKIVEWRALCWKNLNKKKYNNKVSSESVIRFNEPMSYYSAESHSYETATVFCRHRSSYFYTLSGEKTYLFNWKKKDFRILRGKEAEEQKEKIQLARVKKETERKAKREAERLKTIYKPAV